MGWANTACCALGNEDGIQTALWLADRVFVVGGRARRFKIDDHEDPLLTYKQRRCKMKKWGMFLLAAVVALTFSVSAHAMKEMAGAKVSGEVTAVDGEFVSVKNEKGETQKFHMDKTTKITGELKVGAKAEVEEHDGHAMSVMVAKPEAAAPSHD
jgi:hypothetical protein